MCIYIMCILAIQIRGVVRENFSKASASSLANKDQHEPQKVLEGSLVKGNNDSYECILYDVG